MKIRLVSVATAAAVAGVFAVGPAATAQAAPAPAAAAAKAAAKPAATTLPVAGTLADGTAFTGALSNLSTEVVNGVLQLTGTVTGTGLPTGGTDFTAPIQNLAAPKGCSILTLDLGPLNLDLLGLVIDLSPISLDITAVPGAGNLLGNLLCAVAGLLDGGGPLQAISALLDRLLRGLGLGG
ncbi:hypothetical protein BCF74_10478 [Knoellia remsis]|uniref:ABC transporter substrate-binding protein n=1 Tax=Knoellia remsis TaxID=407159 RepID=A0A2T0UXK5_9MICO|nr:ABC transporter substrate-binding protein [Knoellia remsis]PRY62642.1 hypothetical protein BCF74_10478 [Knoellia remsis]